MNFGLIAMLLIIQANEPPADRFNLICRGAGDGDVSRVQSGFVTNSAGQSANAFVTTKERRSFEDVVNVKIDGTTGTIRLPRRLLPPVHGGVDGWQKLKGIKISSEQITASALVNFMNKPRVRVDRLAGTITVDAKNGSFVGRCENVDPGTAERAF